MRTVSIDKQAKLATNRSRGKRTPRGASPGGLGMQRFLLPLLLTGAAVAVIWMIAQLTSEGPRPVAPSPVASETKPTGTSSQGAGPSASNAVLPVSPGNNYPPKIISVEIVPKKPHLGEPLEARAEASDPDGESVSLTYTWVVNGEVVTSGGEPQFATTDLHKHDRIVVRVVPSDGKFDGVEGSSQPVFIVNRPPEITSSPSSTVANGMYTYNVKATDSDGDPLQYRLKQAPDGMTIDAGTGAIQWKISTEHPVVDIGVVASDGDGGEAFQQFKLTVGTGS